MNAKDFLNSDEPISATNFLKSDEAPSASDFLKDGEKPKGGLLSKLKSVIMDQAVSAVEADLGEKEDLGAQILFSNQALPQASLPQAPGALDTIGGMVAGMPAFAGKGMGYLGGLVEESLVDPRERPPLEDIAETAKMRGENIEARLSEKLPFPLTEAGRKEADLMQMGVEKLREKGQEAGEAVLDKTGSPLLATAAATAIEGASELAMLLGIGARAVAPKVKGALPKRMLVDPKLREAAPGTVFLKEKFRERYLKDQKPVQGVKGDSSTVKTIEADNFSLDYRETPKELIISGVAKTKGLDRFQGRGDATRAIKELAEKAIAEGKRVVAEKAEGGANYWDGFMGFEKEGANYVLTPEKLKKIKSREFDIYGWPEYMNDREFAKGFKDYAPAAPEKTEINTLYSGLPIDAAGKALESLWTKNIGSPVWDKFVMQQVPKFLERVPGGKAVNRAMLYDYRGDLPNTPRYVKSLDDMRHHQAVGREYAIDLGRRLQSFDETSQLQMGEAIRGETDIKSLPAAERRVAGEAMRSMYELGKQAVDVGLLGEETFFKNAGRYMPRLYTSKEYQSLLTKYNMAKPNRLDLSRFKRRKDIPKEIREQMGEILTPGYPIAKGIVQMTHDIEMAKFFNGVAKNPDWALPKSADVPIPEGWKQIKGEKLGKLDGAYVHPEIFNDLQETIRVMNKGERYWRKTLGMWKFGKVILSPKTHMRNMMSNSILAHLGGMPMYEQPVYLSKAVKQLREKGDYWRVGKETGVLTDTFTSAELKTLFDQVEGSVTGIDAKNVPARIGALGKALEKVKGSGRGMARLYELEEQWFKMAKMIHNVERRGMNMVEAAKDAEKWLFNYRKLTSAQDKYRSKWYGAPFATFTFKALPRVTEAAVKYPWRFALPAAIVYGLEKAAMEEIGDTPEQFEAKKELRPEWMRKGGALDALNPVPRFARVPFVDENGREHYLNLTYILPWGDIAEGGDFMGIPGSLRPMSQPFVSELAQQIGNKDFFFKKPIVPEEELAGKTKTGKFLTEAKLRSAHAYRSLAPTPFIDIEKGVDALLSKPDYKGHFRNPGVVAADVFLGIKLYPVDYAEELVRRVNKENPKQGYLARKIKGQIKTYAIKRKAMKDAGKETDLYDKLIEDKVKQLAGLAKEVDETGKQAREAGVTGSK